MTDMNRVDFIRPIVEVIDTVMRFPSYPFYQTQRGQAGISILVFSLLLFKIIVKNSLAIFESQTREKSFSCQKYYSCSYFLERHQCVPGVARKFSVPSPSERTERKKIPKLGEVAVFRRTWQPYLSTRHMATHQGVVRK